MCISICVSMSLYMCVSMCVHMSVSVYVYVCGVPNIQFVHLHACQMSQKVQNVKDVSYIFESVCVCPCVYVYKFLHFCVCVWCAKNKLSIFGMFAK